MLNQTSAIISQNENIIVKIDMKLENIRLDEMFWFYKSP